MSISGSLPRGMSFWHPVCLISTGCGVGMLPWFPGTWASLAALPAAWLIREQWGVAGLVAVVAAVFVVGLWSSTVYERRTREHDPGAIVIDEIAAMFLVLTVAPLNWGWFGIGFVLFRIADILKPWPASWADRSLKGGVGVMVDDIFAAFYAMALMWGMMLVLG
jgi:phosphatidylglycerophosphatase A